MKHTAGPWTTANRIVSARAFDGSGKAVVDRVRGGSPGQADANARLIAAAPDLLAACKGALEEFSEWEGPEEEELPGQYASASRARNNAVRSYEAIRAAIQKAEG